MRVDNNVPDAARDVPHHRLSRRAFPWSSSSPSPAPGRAELEILPDTFTFTGPDTAHCGTGTADFLVFDGCRPTPR
jgi:hypothetical protein